MRIEKKLIKDKERICEFCGSTKKVIYYPKLNKMICRRHYDHIRLYGNILDITKYDRYQYEIKKDDYGEYAEIILLNVKHEEVARTQVDIEDIDAIIKYKWRLVDWGYACGKVEKKSMFLQNFILNYDKTIDHIDKNPRNNRKYNLIKSNKSLNSLNCGLRSNNTSGVTGVTYKKNFDVWRSYINWEGERIELGYRKNKDDAIRLRLLKEKELLGNLAPQKHLFKQYGIE
jgi:hypothetical protein